MDGNRVIQVWTVIRWRYLDCLDSTRFSTTQYLTEGAVINEAIRDAELEILATLLMGNGIVVPNNQLMDSYGFLNLLSSLIEEAKDYINKGKTVIVPIRWAKFDYGEGDAVADPFNLVALLFDRDGKEGRKNFELTLWKNMSAKRHEFANYLRKKEPPTYAFIKNIEELKNVSDLYNILDFFSKRSVDTPHIIPAEKSQGIRESLSQSIAKLNSKVIKEDHYFKKMFENNDSAQKEEKILSLLSIANVLNKFEENITQDIRYDRTVIRSELVDKPDFYLQDSYDLRSITQISVLKTIDSIYNFSNFISTRAHQDNQSNFISIKDELWGADEAAFALGQWARINYLSKSRENKYSFDLSSPQNIYIDPDPTRLDEDKNKIWNKYFDAQVESNWADSLSKYIIDQNTFERAKSDYRHNASSREKIHDRSLRLAYENYQKSRENHIKLVSEILKDSKAKVCEKDKKAYLVIMNKSGQIERKITLEDFSEILDLTPEEISAMYSGEIVGSSTSVKLITNDFLN